MGPVDELAKSLLVALRPDFAEREQTARQLAELLLDAVAAALPLTRHEPAEAPLRELEALASQADVYAWEGAPGWDVVLERGLGDRAALEAGPSILDGLGAKSERTQQRGELKRRAHAQATVLVGLAREAARFDAGRQSAGARVLDQEPTLPAAAALLAAHAALLRLVGLGAASSLLLTAEDAGAGELSPSAEEQLLREIDERGEGFFWRRIRPRPPLPPSAPSTPASRSRCAPLPPCAAFATTRATAVSPATPKRSWPPSPPGNPSAGRACAAALPRHGWSSSALPRPDRRCRCGASSASALRASISSRASGSRKT